VGTVKLKEIKEKFTTDHDIHFYKFESEPTSYRLLKEISYQNIPFTKREKTKWYTAYSRVFAGVALLFIVILVGNFIKDNNNNYTDVDSLFLAANIEYVEEPILVSSSYTGEELRIYKAYVEEDGKDIIIYYYFYNQVGDPKVQHLLFVNKDKNINKTVNTQNNFGNLSDLIEITDLNNIEVVIVYNNQQTYSQFFIAKE